MFKNKFSPTGKTQDDDNQWWVLDSSTFHASDRDLKLDPTSNCSSSEKEVDLIPEKKINTNEHKHHPDTEQDFRYENADLSSDEEDLYLTEELQIDEIPEDKTDEADISQREEVPQKVETVHTEEVVSPKKKRKKNKYMRLSIWSTRSSETSRTEDSVNNFPQSIGTKKGKKKKKKKGAETSEDRSLKNYKNYNNIRQLTHRTNKKLGSTKPKAKEKKKGRKSSLKKKKKKKKKKGAETSEDRSLKNYKNYNNIRQLTHRTNKKLGSTKPKAKEKKKGRKSSLKNRIRASLAMIGDQGRVLPKSALEKLEKRIMEKEDPTTPADESSFAFLVEEQKEVDAGPSSKGEVEEPTTEASATPKGTKLGVVLEGGGTDASSDVPSMTPLEQFRKAGQKMRTIMQIQQSAVDSLFAAVFSSHEDEAVNAGLMSKSDRATVDKLLANLQEYESQLKEERNQLAEDREMMILQQESVENLLETENEKTRQLQARVHELENILENEVYRQDNEELVVKVQMLEAEVERQKAALANMATEHQDVLKRQASMDTIGIASMSDFGSSSMSNFRSSISNLGTADSTRDLYIPWTIEEEDHEKNFANFNGAKLQGKLLRLRSSLGRTKSANQEQAKEIASLREQLDQSQQAQRLIQVEATCEDYRNEIKQLKQQLAEVKAARQAENKEEAQAEGEKDGLDSLLDF